MLDELDQALRDMRIHSKLDKKGVRKGVALSQFVTRDAETAADMTAHMMEVIKVVAEAEKRMPHMLEGKALWASVSGD